MKQGLGGFWPSRPCFGGVSSSVWWRRSLPPFSRYTLGCWACLEPPAQTDPGAVEKPCLPKQPFGVRNGISELAFGRQCGLSPGCLWLHSSVLGGKNPRVGLEVKPSSRSCLSCGWQEHMELLIFKLLTQCPMEAAASAPPPFAEIHCLGESCSIQTKLPARNAQAPPNQGLGLQLGRVGNFSSPGWQWLARTLELRVCQVAPHKATGWIMFAVLVFFFPSKNLHFVKKKVNLRWFKWNAPQLHWDNRLYFILVAFSFSLSQFPSFCLCLPEIRQWKWCWCR